MRLARRRRARASRGRTKKTAALAISAGALLVAGQKRVASLVALCAVAIGGGKEKT